MRRIEDHPLWLGSIVDVRDLRSVLDAGVEAVVDLAINEPLPLLTRELIYCRFPLYDGAGNKPELLRLAVRTVCDLLLTATPTLIYCSHGMSRTPALAAAAWAVAHNVSLQQSLEIMTQSAPSDMSPPLLADLAAIVSEMKREEP